MILFFIICVITLLIIIVLLSLLLAITNIKVKKANKAIEQNKKK